MGSMLIAVGLMAVICASVASAQLSNVCSQVPFNNGVDFKHPDDDQCSPRYHKCSNGVMFPLSCLSVLAFDPVNLGCAFPRDVAACASVDTSTTIRTPDMPTSPQTSSVTTTTSVPPTLGTPTTTSTTMKTTQTTGATSAPTQSPVPSGCATDYAEAYEKWSKAFDDWKQTFDNWRKEDC